MNAHAIFGLNPMWLSGIILVIVYIILILEKLNRAVIALFGAMLMIYCGLLNQHQALEKVDFNTLWLLTGMMMLVNITAKTGVFQYVAIRSAKWVKADPVGIMLMLAGITSLFSALLDNVTTVLLITPVTLLITEQLKVRAFPYLFATILASNIGGTATLIGDPPNIIIGSKNDLSFGEFIYHMTPIALIIMLAVCAVLWLIHRRSLKTTLRARAAIISLRVLTEALTPRTINGRNEAKPSAPTAETATFTQEPVSAFGSMKIIRLKFTTVTRPAASLLNSLLDARTTAGPPPIRWGSR